MSSTEQLLKNSLAYFGGAKVPLPKTDPWYVVISFDNRKYMDLIRERFASNFIEPMVIHKGNYLVGKCSNRDAAEAFCNHFSSIIKRLDGHHLKTPFYSGWLSEYLSESRCGIVKISKAPDHDDINRILEFPHYENGFNYHNANRINAFRSLLDYDSETLTDEWVSFLGSKYPRISGRQGVRTVFLEIARVVESKTTSEYFTLPQFLAPKAYLIADKIIACNASEDAVQTATKTKESIANHFAGRNVHLYVLELNAPDLKRVDALTSSFGVYISRACNLPDPDIVESEVLTSYRSARRLLPMNDFDLRDLSIDEGESESMVRAVIEAFIKTVYVTTMVKNTERVSNFIRDYSDSIDETTSIHGFVSDIERCFQKDQGQPE